MRRGGSLALALALLLAGCAGTSVRQVTSVRPLPVPTPIRQQSDAELKWDQWECREQVRDQTGYNTYDSPMANLLQKLFFWGVAGASVGGLVTGFPVLVSSQASDGLIAGAGAGGLAGGAHSWKGQSAFERVWIECMEARGYAIAVPFPMDTRP